MAHKLAPLNTFARVAVVMAPNNATGTLEPVLTGTVTGFLAQSDEPDAVAADNTLSVVGVYVGGQLKEVGGTAVYDAGSWLFVLAGTVLTAALLREKFHSRPPFFIVYKVGALRQVEPLDYTRSLEAVLV